jgi:hypothetical protein
MEVKTLHELDFSNLIDIINKNNNILQLSKKEIIEQLKYKVDNNIIDCIVFSPKYREQAKTAFANICTSKIGQIVFFGGFRTHYGYYKYSENQIFLFEIYQNQIKIDNL